MWPTSIQSGVLFLDKYRILRELGAGGMGTVYEAIHEITRQRHAIKVLHPDAQAVPGAEERFFREASAAGRIGHEHIVRSFDAGKLPTGELYLVMELLSGEPLSAHIRRAPHGLDWRVATALISQVCNAIDAAHNEGVIHRDLKPDNLFLLQKEGKLFVKVLDFGISKFSGDDLEELTRTGQALGTPSYMAPEQMEGRADARSDIFALGVILYKCLVGAVPFKSSTPAERSRHIRAGVYPSIASARPDVPEAIENIVARCLAWRPADRFPSARALGQALRNAASEAGPPSTTEAASTDRATASPHAERPGDARDVPTTNIRKPRRLSDEAATVVDHKARDLDDDRPDGRPEQNAAPTAGAAPRPALAAHVRRDIVRWIARILAIGLATALVARIAVMASSDTTSASAAPTGGATTAAASGPPATTSASAAPTGGATAATASGSPATTSASAAPPGGATTAAASSFPPHKSAGPTTSASAYARPSSTRDSTAPTRPAPPIETVNPFASSPPK